MTMQEEALDEIRKARDEAVKVALDEIQKAKDEAIKAIREEAQRAKDIAIKAVSKISNNGPTLQLGSIGSDVKRLQRILVMLKLLAFTDIDGVFGPKTKQAVETFQSGRTDVNGIVDLSTWSLLPANPGTIELHLGSSGSTVAALQEGLVKFKGKNTSTDPGKLDGYFGVKTLSAVRAYQLAHGVSSDGSIVGDRTWWVPTGSDGATLASLAGLTTV